MSKLPSTSEVGPAINTLFSKHLQHCAGGGPSGLVANCHTDIKLRSIPAITRRGAVHVIDRRTRQAPMVQRKDPRKPEASPCMHYPSSYAVNAGS